MTIDDLSSAANVPDGVREVAFEWLSKGRGGGFDTAGWAEITAKALIKNERSAVCNSVIQPSAYVAGKQTATNVDHEAARWYFDWLINRSWASSLIVSPDVDFARKNGFVISGALPANVVVGILILQRQWREHSGVVEFAYDILQRYGVSEDFAFLAAFSVSMTGVGYCNTNHFPIAPTTLDYWSNFLDRRIVGAMKRPLAESADYRGGVTSMWGKSSAYNDPEFYKLLKKAADVRESKEKTVVVPNPFKPLVKAGAAIVPSKEDVERLIPGLAEYFLKTNVRNAA